MSLDQTNILKQVRRSHSGNVDLTIEAEFLRAALILAVGLGLLLCCLPGLESATFLLAMALYGGAAAITRWCLLRSTYPHDRLGLCNLVTLGRLGLVCVLLALLLLDGGRSWVFFSLASVALALDGIDGWLARRQRLVSQFGARFDVEVDSLLALVLALNAALDPKISSLVLLLGLPRYAFCAAAYFLPWLMQDLPERFSRKLVCVMQIAVLIAIQAPVLPVLYLAILIPVVALALIWSFAIDIIWLWQARK